MGRPITAYTGAWAKFVEVFGGPTRCSEVLGIARGSLDRWAAGHEPSPAYRQLIVHLSRQHGVANPLETPTPTCPMCSGLGFMRTGTNGEAPDTLVPCGACSVAPPVNLELA